MAPKRRKSHHSPASSKPSTTNVSDSDAMAETQAWTSIFNNYSSTEDSIEAEGIEKLFLDLNLPIDSIAALGLLYEIKAKKMGTLTKQEFLSIPKAFASNCTIKTISDLKRETDKIEQSFQDGDKFKSLYLWSFDFCKLDQTQKSLPSPIAAEMLTILIGKCGLFHAQKIIDFLVERTDKNKVINRDQWRGILEFTMTMDEGMSLYEENGSWPLLIDEYVSNLKEISRNAV